MALVSVAMRHIQCCPATQVAQGGEAVTWLSALFEELHAMRDRLFSARAGRCAQLL